MAWCDIEGHDDVVEKFRRRLALGRMASSYLFVGPPGIGKRTFALRLAQGLLCSTVPNERLQPCLNCPDCMQIAADSHPNVDVVSRPPDKSVIPIELLIGDLEHRNQEGLCHRIALKPSRGRWRIAIIDDADSLNTPGANSLLKTLEEPPPHSLLILIGSSPQRQLPTIRSRCQIVRFEPLADEFVRQYALEQEFCSADDVDWLVNVAAGSLERAREFSDVAIRQFANDLSERWNQPAPETVRTAREIQAFVDEAGQDAPVRRNRLRQVIELMIQALRTEIVATAKGTSQGQRLEWAQQQQLEIADERIERCMVALQEVDANANLATLIECWIDDLGQAFYRRSRA